MKNSLTQLLNLLNQEQNLLSYLKTRKVRNCHCFLIKYREALCNTLVIIDLVIQWRSRTTNALSFDADSKSYLRQHIMIKAT